MEKQIEQEVWRRVRGPGGPTAEEALLPERLEALIVEQQAEAAELRSIARRLRGQQSAALTRIAAGVEARVRALTTLHYLLTGRRLRLQPPGAKANAPVSEALRSLSLRLRQTEVGRHERLGGHGSPLSDCLPCRHSDRGSGLDAFVCRRQTDMRRLVAEEIIAELRAVADEHDRLGENG